MRKTYNHSKFNNKKTIIDGIVFPSKLEAERYMELKELENSGLIVNLRLQVEFELIPSFKKINKTYRKCVYKSDFTYFDVMQQKQIVEDTKGFKTDVYKIKRKLFEYTYPDLEITEIKKEKKKNEK